MEPVAFDKYFDEFKEKYPFFRNENDYRLFTLLVIKYMFYPGDDAGFGQDNIQDALTDGSKDGGIDAIINDPASDNNDVVIIQSKYLNKTALSPDSIAGELYKIQETLEEFKKNRFSSRSAKAVTAFKNAMLGKTDDKDIRIVFITSYEPKNLKERHKLERAAKKGIKYPVELLFNSDINNQIMSVNSGKVCVEYDTLDLDKANNYLKYTNPKSERVSVMVNVSALSLQDLYQRRRNNLLGLNLRYYVKQTAIDNAIKETITREPELFWYKNNGIVIICNNYAIDGTKLKLWGFSIINGGQTTNRIGNLDIEPDKNFYITCKVVQMEGIEQAEQDKFALKIAESSNAQKPIRKVDLVANTTEQIRLKQRLKEIGVYYLTKKGEPKPKKVEKYCVTNVDQVGKLSLAVAMQMPASARNNSKKMYNSEYFYSIYGNDARCGVIADALRISAYYEKFRKEDLVAKGFDKTVTIPMISSGRTFQLACIAFLCKISYGVFSYEDVEKHFNDDDYEELKRVLKKMGDMEHLISVKYDNEEEIFREIFSEIGESVLGDCYQNAIDREETATVSATNYMKKDFNYYKYVLKKLWSVYKRHSKLNNDIAKICGMDK